MGLSNMKMNLFCKSIFCAAALLAAFSVHAKTVNMGFQIGDVVAAEMSQFPVRIIDREHSPYPNEFRSCVYAVVVVKLLPLRSLNSEDYALKIGNVTANCMAICSNNGNFVSSSQNLYSNDNDYLRMVFVFDGSKVRGNGKVMPAMLVSKLSGRSSLKLNITDLGKQAFSDVKKIPKTGLLK